METGLWAWFIGSKRLLNRKSLDRAQCFMPPPPQKKKKWGRSLVFDECQPPALRKPPHFGAENPKWGGGQKVQKCSKREHFWRILHGVFSDLGPKIPIFRALRARSIIHSLQLGSHPRLGPKVACFTTTCAKMSKTHQKTHESHPKTTKHLHTPLKTTFFTVYRKIFSEVAPPVPPHTYRFHPPPLKWFPPPPQAFQDGGAPCISPNPI